MSVVDLDDCRPHVVLKTNKRVAVVPVEMLKRFRDGLLPLKDIEGPEFIFRAIVREWLDML